MTSKCRIVELCELGAAIMVDKGFAIADLKTLHRRDFIILPIRIVHGIIPVTVAHQAFKVWKLCAKLQICHHS